MKKWFGIAVILVLLIVCILPAKAEAATSGYYTYTVSNGKATITDCDTSVKGAITIPSKLGGYPVTEIGGSAFWNCEYLTSVTIPSSVTSIGSYAFSYCGRLATVNIPDGASLGTGAFRGCGMTSITIPDTVTAIGTQTFSSCANLTSVTIGNGVTSIGSEAFGYCSKLTSVTVGSSVKSISQNAFTYCSKLTDVFYKGTESQWKKVSIGTGNDYLKNAKVCCAVTVDATLYPESEHNYANNLNESKTFSWPRATKLEITFNGSTFTQANYDYIYLYDGAGKQIAKYTGSAAANKTVAISGDTFTVKLTSNGSTQKYGYAFSSIVAYMPKHNDHSVCGEKCACTSTTHSSLKWTAWDGTTKLYNGNYYLTQDVVLDSTMILDYNYVSYLCLNGYSITCESTVFNIYSLRTLVITDCIGTGKIETKTSGATIRNNKTFTMWGGTVLNSSDSHYNAIQAYASTKTKVYGGRVESKNGETIYAYPGADVQVYGGEVYSEDASAFIGHNDNSGNLANLTISGGRLATNNPLYCSAVDAQNGNFTMTGGYLDGDVCLYDENGFAAISGGTIRGELYANCEISISGGIIASAWLNSDATITAGTFQDECTFAGSNNAISGGNFSTCGEINICGKTWICGGSYSLIRVDAASLYLSGLPEIDTIQLACTSWVSAKNPDGTGSYGGDTIWLRTDHPYITTAWVDGNTLINNVASDMVAQKFVLAEASEWEYVEHVGGKLVLRIIPHGTWGGNVEWRLDKGVLTISGTGTITATHSGALYPWGNYTDLITSIIVNPGINGIPSYTFEYCRKATTIQLPETLKALALNAFNDCWKLNHLLLPPSIESISGSSNTGYPAFIRCSALTDVYYLGTEDAWNSIPNATFVTNADAEMKMHFLKLHENLPTCTENGTQPFYAFDDNSVYDEMYDQENRIITELGVIPATGHTFTEATCTAPKTCTVCGATEGGMADHSGDLWFDIIMPNCTAEGLKARICTVCNETETQSVAALGHSYNSLVTAPTCTEQGYTTKTCATCGDTTVTDYVAATGHSLDSVVTAPTCTEQGYTTNTCSVCGDVTVTDYVDATGHSFGIWTQTKAPACTEAGEEARTCACGETETQPVAALGHSYSAIVTAPTCTEQGYTTNTCSVCGDVTVTDYVDATGHSFGAWEQTVAPGCVTVGEEKRSCACGEIETQTVPAKGHSWSAWITTVKPTCTTEGAQMRFCNCGTRETEVIAKLPHSLENYTCTVCGELDYANTVLTGDVQVNWNLTQDLYVDLNGFDLSGTIITNGYKVYGMDSTTDSYTCENVGYFTCVDENGDFIVPESIYTNGEKQYMAICVEDRYSFHRFFVGVTHMSLEPKVVGLGYKAAVFGDEMVLAELAETKAFSFCVQLEGYSPVYRHFDSNELASGEPITLRIRNYDVENYSEHNLYAQASLTLNDGTVIETGLVALTFRWLTEQVNANYTDYTNEQITQFKAMLQAFDIVKKWNIPNLI